MGVITCVLGGLKRAGEGLSSPPCHIHRYETWVVMQAHPDVLIHNERSMALCQMGVANEIINQASGLGRREVAAPQLAQ